MAAKPANFTSDRLDKVTVGQFVHFDIPVLIRKTPKDGWSAVTAVASTGSMVTLTFSGGSYTGRVDQLIQIGWS